MENTNDEKIRNGINTFLKVMLGRHDKDCFNGKFLEVRLIAKEGYPQQIFLPTGICDLDRRLADIVEQAAEGRKNVYVGLALRDNNRTGRDQDCSIITMLVVDYDELGGVKIKDIKDDLEREQARVNLLERLQNETDYPPSMIVDSGHGYHAYYALDAVVNVRATNEAIKRKLKWLSCRYPEAPGDPAMMRLSQPIRLPGSFNVKNPNEPRPCQVIECHPERVYAFDDLPEADVKGVLKLMPHRVPKTPNCDFPVWECAFLRWMMEHPAEQTYLLWMAAASTLAYLGEEGRKIFHALSEKYVGYSESETDGLFDEMLASQERGIGPVTYAKLAEFGFWESDSTDYPSPAVYIKRLWQNHMLPKMGIGYDEETGKVTFNPNTFTEDFLEENQIVLHDGSMFYQYQDGVFQPVSELGLTRRIRDAFQSVKKGLYRSWMGTAGVEMLKIAAPEVKQMDTHKQLLNLANGMLDTNNFKLLPHSPDYFSTVQIPLSYEPTAQCARFEQFVDEIMDGDRTRIQVLQELVGYLLTAETIIHKAFFLHGEGSNGKSLLLEIVAMLVGPENVSNLTLQDLENPFRRSSLIGKTVNIATENEINGRGFNSQYFKAIVSGDRIQVERKYENSTSLAPICKLVFAVNNLPYSADKTHGLYRRILILPFERRFEGKLADKHLKETLKNELSGIMNWALIGLQRLRQQDYEFTSSAAINNAVECYRKEQNPLLDYMVEMIEVTKKEERVLKTKMLEKYRIWCQCNGLGDTVKMSPQKFWNTFRSNCKELGLPYEMKVSNGVRYLSGLRFKHTDFQSF